MGEAGTVIAAALFGTIAVLGALWLIAAGLLAIQEFQQKRKIRKILEAPRG